MDKPRAREAKRDRARALGVQPGILSPGQLNAITDVPGVLVGHETVIEGDDVRTGATAILPHDGNLFRDRVPAGVAVANGYGKLMGATQIAELGEIETPIVLTNTLAVPRAADAILDWTLEHSDNAAAVSINPVVGETNDGRLNAIHRRTLTPERIRRALDTAHGGPVEGGCVGAGTGTIACGWKAGIGTSSRTLPAGLGGYVVGVIVQANFPGILQILGVPIGRILRGSCLSDAIGGGDAHGSIMIVAATDAALSDRNLTRLARRTFAGLARAGASFANGSGDYAIAFSASAAARRTPDRRAGEIEIPDVANESVSGLFQAAIEATEEAIYDAWFLATTMTGRGERTVESLPIADVLDLLRSHTALGEGNLT
jgi:D-aminopeptidase